MSRNENRLLLRVCHNAYLLQTFNCKHSLRNETIQKHQESTDEHIVQQGNGMCVYASCVDYVQIDCQPFRSSSSSSCCFFVHFHHYLLLSLSVWNKCLLFITFSSHCNCTHRIKRKRTNDIQQRNRKIIAKGNVSVVSHLLGLFSSPIFIICVFICRFASSFGVSTVLWTFLSIFFLHLILIFFQRRSNSFLFICYLCCLALTIWLAGWLAKCA